MTEMTEALVSRGCKQKGFFRTPELNDQLYLHFSGFTKIENLEAFTGVRSIWLENNAVADIENLEALPKLACLYLQNNCLRSLGSCALPRLDVLNVAHNSVASLSGAANFSRMTRFLAANNEVGDGELHHLLACPALTVVDLSHNKLSDAAVVAEVFPQLARLATLMLSGNAVVRAIKPYRKRLVHQNRSLRYLDEYPVFDDERRCSDAWGADGPAAEKLEREAIREEDVATKKRHMQFFADVVADARRKGRGEAQPNTAYHATMAKLQADANAKTAASAKTGAETDAAASGAAPIRAAPQNDNDDDDDEVYIPAAAVAAATVSSNKPRGALRSKAPTARHADPMSALDDESAISPAPSVDAGPTEAEVLAGVSVDAELLAKLATVVDTPATEASAETD
jgi:hypothetical protein